MAANDVTGTLPPFPEDVPTHPLLVIDYDKIKAGDKAEQVRPQSVYITLPFDISCISIGHSVGSMHLARFLLVRVCYHIGPSVCVSIRCMAASRTMVLTQSPCGKWEGLQWPCLLRKR